MPLLLSRNYLRTLDLASKRADLFVAPDHADGGTEELCVGIINIMPETERYEPFLLKALGTSSVTVRPIWIRLQSHDYTSSDTKRLDDFYVSFADAVDTYPLHGLIITGAPVETLDFTQVRYWSELRDIIQYARKYIPRTFGICWGGMALAHVLGAEKVNFPQKMFGLYPTLNTDSEHPVTGGLGTRFVIPQSRHSGMSADSLRELQTDGTLRLLARLEHHDHTIFESADRSVLINLGHLEYNPKRLLDEMERDSQRNDVPAPTNFPTPGNQNIWKAKREIFFSAWIDDCFRRKTSPVTSTPPRTQDAPIP